MDRLYTTTVAVPAGTLQSAPFIQQLPLEDANLKRVTITVPDGHNGLTGIRVLWANQQIVPWGNNSYITANNRTIDVDFNDYITVSGLTFQAFNIDVFAHSFYCELTVTDTLSRQQLAQTPATATAVVSSATPPVQDPLSPDALIASLPVDVAAALGIT